MVKVTLEEQPSVPASSQRGKFPARFLFHKESALSGSGLLLFSDPAESVPP